MVGDTGGANGIEKEQGEEGLSAGRFSGGKENRLGKTVRMEVWADRAESWCGPMETSFWDMPVLNGSLVMKANFSFSL